MIYAYARINDSTIVEYPVYEGDLRLLLGQSDYSVPLLPTEDYVAVLDVAPPQVDHTQVLEEALPELEEGEWWRHWVVRDATQEELDERHLIASARARETRNKLLLECDWTQLLDSPVDREPWAAYRQELRDIPGQPGFPWDVQWPSAPGANFVRARNELGQYVGDDPATPDVNEAWVEAS